MASERQKTSTTSKAALRTSKAEKEKHRLTHISSQSLSFEKRGKKARLIHLSPLPTWRVKESKAWSNEFYEWQGEEDTGGQGRTRDTRATRLFYPAPK